MSKNSDEWWCEYVPADVMVEVGLENDLLQEKLNRKNIKICELCNNKYNRKLFISPGCVINCEVAIGKRINLVDEKFFPSGCIYKLEHIMCFNKEGC